MRSTGQSSESSILNLEGRRLRGTRLCLPQSRLGRKSITCSNFTHFRPSALPASVLDEEDDDDDEEVIGESRDDERSGTRYNVRGLLTSFRDCIC